MDIEIIQNHADFFGLREMDIYDVTEQVGEIVRFSVCRDGAIAPTGVRFKHHEQIAGAVPDVFVVLTGHLPRRWRDGFAAIGDQLAGTLIDTDQGLGRVIGLGILRQDVLHAPYKIRPNGRYTPFFFEPGLEVAFFKTRPMVSWETGASTTPNSTILSANICILQRS